MEHIKKQIGKKLWVLFAIVLFIAVSIQFTSPKVLNPPVTSEIMVSPAVAQILKKSCYDCHSNQTKLKWFDKLAPVSWIVASDIKTARSRFNFSQWNDLTTADQQVKFWEMINMAENKKMPLPSYLRLHPEAKLDKKDIEILKQYAQRFIISKPGDTMAVNAADREFKIFQAGNKFSDPAPVSLNGIRYYGDYRNWKVMVATTRLENGTMRIVYGNDIIIRAIQEGNINPFPSGSVIVKVVWNIIEDSEGNIRPGTFNNTQWMVKDEVKYPDTKGWGFARFNGTKLLPYGKNSASLTACFNCHKLVKETGYVFDLPVEKKAN
ncbi:heme-binding domain-containing protein [Pedobacter jamesrossensis]|uniref:Heme-binding domain-containing protein n=1 Tax=Pedobacter jamesrossensis TaxID=1908238 RepID=A0ABV8NMK1_9SPHI